jgi:hypothetical protein
MVKIRYAELPAGLHVATEADDRCTVVYLKPGLTRAQRKDALTVARRSARFGHGPSLPPLDMAFALAADRSRTTARITVTAMRKHPLLLLPLLGFVAGIIAVGMLAAAAMLTVMPNISSAQPTGRYEFNIGRLMNPAPSSSPGSSSETHRPAVTGAAGGGPGQPVSHGGHARHGRAHTRAHSVAGLQRAAPAGQGRGHA